MTRTIALVFLICLPLVIGCASKMSSDPRAQARARFLERLAEQKLEEARKLRGMAAQFQSRANQLEQESVVYKRKAERAAKGEDVDAVTEGR